MDQYWRVLQQRVCRKCIDGNGGGDCRLPKGQTCAVQEFLPAVVRVVKSTRSDRYDDYVTALRADVCSGCREQDAAGVCRRREAVECALDRYYGLVLHVIEAVDAGEVPV